MANGIGEGGCVHAILLGPWPLGGREGRVPGSCEAQRPCVGNRPGHKRRESMRVHLHFHEDGSQGRFHALCSHAASSRGRAADRKMEVDGRWFVDDGARIGDACFPPESTVNFPCQGSGLRAEQGPVPGAWTMQGTKLNPRFSMASSFQLSHQIPSHPIFGIMTATSWQHPKSTRAHRHPSSLVQLRRLN